MSIPTSILLAYAFRSLGPALSVLSLAVLLVGGLTVVALVAYLASLPGRVADARGHPRSEAVRACGWLGLPTGVGWVVAMVWAFATPDPRSPSVRARLDDLERAVADLESVAEGGQG